MKTKITWAEKRDVPKDIQITVLGKSFADVPVGASMLIPTPRVVDQAVRDLPPGVFMDVKAFRRELAHTHGVEVCCPLTTGIFLRIVAEAAYEDELAGREGVTPVWRVIDPKSPLGKKITPGPDWLARHRAIEGF